MPEGDQNDFVCKSRIIEYEIRPEARRIAKRASDVMTQTRLRQTNRKLRTILLKHFLKQSVFLKHTFETKTSPRFPLVLSEHADVV